MTLGLCISTGQAQTDPSSPSSDYIKARENTSSVAAPTTSDNDEGTSETDVDTDEDNSIETKRAELPPEARSIDRIVAVADEDVILESELEQSIEGIRQQVRSRGGAMPPEDLLRQQVLDRMILNKLQVQRALTTGIRVSDADVDQALARVAQQNNIDIITLRQTLERDGFQFSDFRDELRDELIISRMRERIGQSLPDVTNTEIEIMLASDQFGGAQYNLSHLLVAVPDGANPDQVATAREKIDEVYARLQNGLEFSAAAISYSDAQDALEGGQIGWRSLNTMPKVFADSIGNLDAGEFSEPVRSPAGFHVLYLNEVRDQSVVMVEEIKASHLMVSTSELVNSEQARNRIMTIKSRLDDGESFAELAKEFSDDTMTANLGGDMGWIRPEQYGARFKQIIDSLAMNQPSEPFQDENGWHIMMVEDQRQSDFTEIAERNLARENIRQQKTEQEYERFLRQLRDESYIDKRI